MQANRDTIAIIREAYANADIIYRCLFIARIRTTTLFKDPDQNLELVFVPRRA